jgi:hypothetical protein
MPHPFCGEIIEENLRETTIYLTIKKKPHNLVIPAEAGMKLDVKKYISAKPLHLKPNITIPM